MHSARVCTVLTWPAVFRPIRRPRSGPKCWSGRTVPAARRTAVHAVHRGLLYSRSVWYDVRDMSDDNQPAISRNQAPKDVVRRQAMCVGRRIHSICKGLDHLHVKVIRPDRLRSRPLFVPTPGWIVTVLRRHFATTPGVVVISHSTVTSSDSPAFVSAPLPDLGLEGVM